MDTARDGSLRLSRLRQNFKVANHVVSVIGFTDLQDRCSNIAGKENRSYHS